MGPSASSLPSVIPSSLPTSSPSAVPTSLPSVLHSSSPSAIPSSLPSVIPSSLPTLLPSAVSTSLPSQPTSVKLLALEGGTESIEQNKGTTFSTTSKRRTSRHSQRKKHPRGLQKLRSSKSLSSYSSFIPM